jgi:hypothetical protein
MTNPGIALVDILERTVILPPKTTYDTDKFVGDFDA